MNGLTHHTIVPKGVCVKLGAECPTFGRRPMTHASVRYGHRLVGALIGRPVAVRSVACERLRVSRIGGRHLVRRRVEPVLLVWPGSSLCTGLRIVERGGASRWPAAVAIDPDQFRRHSGLPIDRDPAALPDSPVGRSVVFACPCDAAHSAKGHSIRAAADRWTEGRSRESPACVVAPIRVIARLDGYSPGNGVTGASRWSWRVNAGSLPWSRLACRVVQGGAGLSHERQRSASGSGYRAGRAGTVMDPFREPTGESPCANLTSRHAVASSLRTRRSPPG